MGSRSPHGYSLASKKCVIVLLLLTWGGGREGGGGEVGDFEHLSVLYLSASYNNGNRYLWKAGRDLGMRLTVEHVWVLGVVYVY